MSLLPRLLLLSLIVCFLGEASAQVVRYQGADGRLYFTNLPMLPASPRKAKTPRRRKAPQPPTQHELWQRYCRAVGTYGYQVARRRDAGGDPRDSLRLLYERETMTEDLRRDLRNIVIHLYTHWWETPRTTQRRAEVGCLAGWKP